jgi:hypothetical protein
MEIMTRNKRGAILVILASLAVLWFSAGCGDRVSGERFTNQPPEMYFVNIPPGGTRTSVDPAVYWVGTDRDGLIDHYRYHVVRIDEMDGLGPDEYIQTVLSNLPDDAWTYVTIEVDNPATTNVVSISADLNDPVSTYIESYIFAQAFDDRGASSQIVYTQFFRNDNPPDTDINLENKVFIDAAQPGGAITGIRFAVDAEDPDPADSLFEFRWKILGPYISDEESGAGEWELMLDEYVRTAVLTNDARVYIIGYGFIDTVVTTTLADGELVIESSLVLMDTFDTDIDPFYGSFRQVLDMEALEQDPFNYRAVDSSLSGGSAWVSNNRSPLYRDSVFNVYRNAPSDSTIQRKFLIWAQCRDAARVGDGIPAWVDRDVVLPRYERDIILLDFVGLFGRINAPVAPLGGVDSSKAYWKRAIDSWSDRYQGGTVQFDVFDQGTDWVNLPSIGQRISLAKLLGYKTIILYNDNINPPGFIELAGSGISAVGQAVFTAIDAGVTVLAMWRAPFEGGIVRPFDDVMIPPASYQGYFGIKNFVYTGWANAARDGINVDTLPVRIEDFMGGLALSNDVPGWPDINVDTANLHSRYLWFSSARSDSAWAWDPGYWEKPDGTFGPRKLDPTVYALPEVGWTALTDHAQALYLYKSHYGRRPPFGTRYIFDGRNIAARVETNMYRTAHFMFTPLGMEDGPMQTIIDSLMNFLYDPDLASRSASTASNANRYPNAPVYIDPADVRERFIERMKTIDEHGYFEPGTSE